MSSPARFGAALGNPRFQAVLLCVFCIPSLALFGFLFIVLPFVAPAHPADSDAYFAAAGALSKGANPYLPALQSTSPTTASAYLYPPLPAVLVLPLLQLKSGLAHAILSAVLALASLAFLWPLVASLGLRDSRGRLAFVALTLGFYPLWESVALEQINGLLLTLSACWFLGFVRGPGSAWRSVGGSAALGLAIALKVFQLPLLLVEIAARRAWPAAIVVLTVAGLWLLAAPSQLPAYFEVLPKLSAGTALWVNQAPAALFERALAPSAFYTPTAPSAWLRTVALLLGLASLGLSLRYFWPHLRQLRHPANPISRVLVASWVIILTPISLTVVWTDHLVLLLVPLLALAVIAWRRRDRIALALLAASYTLLGPVHLLFASLMTAGYKIHVLPPAASTHPGLDVTVRILVAAGPLAMFALLVCAVRCAHLTNDEDHRSLDGDIA